MENPETVAEPQDAPAEARSEESNGGEVAEAMALVETEAEKDADEKPPDAPAAEGTDDQTPKSGEDEAEAAENGGSKPLGVNQEDWDNAIITVLKEHPGPQHYRNIVAWIAEHDPPLLGDGIKSSALAASCNGQLHRLCRTSQSGVKKAKKAHFQFIPESERGKKKAAEAKGSDAKDEGEKDGEKEGDEGEEGEEENEENTDDDKADESGKEGPDGDKKAKGESGDEAEKSDAGEEGGASVDAMDVEGTKKAGKGEGKAVKKEPSTDAAAAADKGDKPAFKFIKRRGRQATEDDLEQVTAALAAKKAKRKRDGSPDGDDSPPKKKLPQRSRRPTQFYSGAGAGGPLGDAIVGEVHYLRQALQADVIEQRKDRALIHNKFGDLDSNMKLLMHSLDSLQAQLAVLQAKREQPVAS